MVKLIKQLSPVRNVGIENTGLGKNRGIGKECGCKTEDQETAGILEGLVFGWAAETTG